jgi:DNA-binding NarL/FixJ family response regulator
MEATGLDGDMTRELRVVLADGEVATRMGVRRALEAGGMRVVAEASSASEAVAVAVANQCDVCLLGVRIPGGGILAAEQIRQALPGVKIVMLSASDRDEDLFGALRAGADGYLLKSTSGARLPHAIRGVVAGEAALPRELTARLIQEFRDRGRQRRMPISVAGRDVELTSREYEVLELLREPQTTSQIANRLQISDVTVRRHISAVLHKLGVRDRRSAIELLEQAA